MRGSAKLGLLVGVAALGIAAAACGYTRGVNVNESGFSPRVGIVTDECDSAVWHNTGSSTHSATSNAFFDTGDIAPGGSSPTIDFPVAGTFHYRDAHHTKATGSIVVPLYVTPSAAKGESIAIVWNGDNCTATALPAGRRVDVQVKRPGARHWRTIVSNSTGDSTAFTVRKKGNYKFRSRLEIAGPPVVDSGWSVAVCRVS